MKVVGNKRRNAFKLSFLRCSTYESGMIVELFSDRPFIKILFSRFTISFSRFRITMILPEISRKFPENSRKILGNFPEFSLPLIHQYSPTPHLIHPQSPNPRCPEPPQNFKPVFIKSTI